jgi:hypothetical protein
VVQYTIPLEPFEFDYFGKLETELEKILGYESGAQMGSFDGKKLGA